jgi:hypothetical protein
MEDKGSSLCSTWLRKLNENTAIATDDRHNLSRLLTAADPRTPEEFFKVKLVGGVLDKQPLLNFLSACIKEVEGPIDARLALLSSVRCSFVVVVCCVVVDGLDVFVWLVLWCGGVCALICRVSLEA